MGNPKKVTQTWTQGLQDSARDLTSGDIERAAYGSINLATYGTARMAGMKSQTELERDAKTAADAEAADEANLTALTKQAKLDKIRNRLDAEVKLRQKSPGRQQTLLTSLLEPSKTNPQTALITTMNGKR